MIPAPTINWSASLTMPKNKNLWKFALRLPLSMRREATTLAESEGISINQFIALAVAEKITRMDLIVSGENADR